MKHTLALLLPVCVLLALIGQSSVLADHSNSLEAKTRKDTCKGLVAKKDHSSHQDSSEEATPASPATGSPPTATPDYPCTLTDALLNISSSLDEDEEDILEAFVLEIQITILLDVTLTEEEKVVKCSYALKHFFELHVSIRQKVVFTQLSTWGLFWDFLYVSVDLQADLVENVCTLDSNDNCPMFDALLNATAGDAQKHAACIELVEEMRVILMDVSLTFAQKMAKLHIIIKAFFDLHPDWKDFFLSIEIEGFGSFESLIDVCKGYDQAMTLSDVVGGSSDSDCEVCRALTEASANTSYSLSVRSQIKAFHDKIVAYFATTVDIQLRLTYITSQYYQLEIVEPWIVQYLFQISLKVNGEEWGCFYDLLWVSQFCYNSGSCGNLNEGMGTTQGPSTTKSTTPRPPPDCAGRANLIMVTTQNTTVLTDVLTQNYNTWNATTKSGFNTCFNQVRSAIWDNVKYPSFSSKIAAILTAFKAYNPNNPTKQAVLYDIVIQVWGSYTIRDFVNCG